MFVLRRRLRSKHQPDPVLFAPPMDDPVADEPGRIRTVPTVTVRRPRIQAPVTETYKPAGPFLSGTLHRVARLPFTSLES